MERLRTWHRRACGLIICTAQPLGWRWSCVVSNRRDCECKSGAHLRYGALLAESFTSKTSARPGAIRASPASAWPSPREVIGRPPSSEADKVEGARGRRFTAGLRAFHLDSTKSSEKRLDCRKPKGRAVENKKVSKTKRTLPYCIVGSWHQTPPTPLAQQASRLLALRLHGLD